MNEPPADDHTDGAGDDRLGANDPAPLIPSIPVPPVTDIEPVINPVIKDLPIEKQREIIHSIQESFTAVIAAQAGGPKIDPQTAQILTDAQDKDNERKFQFFKLREENVAKKQEREHDLEAVRHRDINRLMWPIVIAVLFAVLGGGTSGIVLASTGRETLGASILSGIFSAVLGYLGGLGTAHFFKQK